MKRLMVMALAVLMVFSCLFMTAFADDLDVAPVCEDVTPTEEVVPTEETEAPTEEDLPDCEIPECEAPAAPKETIIKLSKNPTVVPYDGEQKAVDATVITVDGEYVKDAKVLVYYAGVGNDGEETSYNSTVAPSDIGIYQVFATYAGNEDYAPATNTTILVIHDYWAELSKVVFEEPVKVVEYNGRPQSQSAEAQNLLGKKIGDPVIFYFNGVCYTTHEPSAVGVYPVIAVYPGNEHFAASYNVGKLIIECPPAPEPTEPPVEEPTEAPTEPSVEPTTEPTEEPTVAPTEPEHDNPQTGDFNVTFMWFGAMALCMIGIFCVIVLINKRAFDF